jgi:phosphoribosylamine--glycine ligase
VPGYPGTVQKGAPIEGLAAADAVEDCMVFHAGTKRVDDAIVTDGGRVLGVTALGDTLEAALARAYEGVGHIRFPGMQFRRDIGRHAVGRTTGGRAG